MSHSLNFVRMKWRIEKKRKKKEERVKSEVIRLKEKQWIKRKRMKWEKEYVLDKNIWDLGPGIWERSA